jgi:hypothetical protein
MPPRPIPSGKKKEAKKSKGTPPAKTKPLFTRRQRTRIVAENVLVPVGAPVRVIDIEDEEEAMEALNQLYLWREYCRNFKFVNDVMLAVHALQDANRFVEARNLLDRLDKWQNERV